MWFHADRAWLLLIATTVALGTVGCTQNLAMLMVSAPNRFNPLSGEGNPLPPLESLAADQHFWVRVGPPNASLSVSVIEPPAGQTPRGTVLVVHGIFARGLTMLPQAKALARNGYRAVLVDLRGHGRSSGEFLTFGVREARDLSQVIDALEQRQLVAGQMGAYGISYGATTSIHLAARDPRIRAVVAVQPFGLLRPEVENYSEVMLPGIGSLIPRSRYRQALDEAGRIAGFDPDRSDAVDAIQRTDAPVLLIHGTNDWLVPYWNSILLQQAAPDHSERIAIDGGGHASLWLDADGAVSAHALEWFNKWLAPDGE